MAFNAEYKIVNFFSQKEIKTINYKNIGGATVVGISWNNSNTKVEFYPYNATWSEAEEWLTYNYEDLSEVGSNNKLFRLEIIAAQNTHIAPRVHDYKIVITDRVSNEVREYIITINQEMGNIPSYAELVTDWPNNRAVVPYNAIGTPVSDALVLSVEGYSGDITYSVNKNRIGGFVRTIRKVAYDSFIFMFSGANELIQREETLTATATLADGRVLEKEITIVQREYPQTTDIIILENPLNNVLPYEGGAFNIVLEYDKFILIDTLNIVKYGGQETEYTVEINNNILTVTLNPNTYNKERVISFALVGMHEHKTEPQKLYFSAVQAAAPDIISVAAYQDNYVEIQVEGSITNYPYTIKEGGTNNILYSGNAFVKDGYTSIYINGILNKFTQPKLNTNTNILRNTNNYKRFDLYDSNNALVKIIYYNNNWNYDNKTPYSSYSSGLNMPISNNFVVGQIIPFSYMQSHRDNPKTLSVQVQQQRPAIIANTTIGSNTILFSGLVDKGNKVRLRADGEEVRVYDIVEECNNNLYAIIYRNILGGYDSVLFSDRTAQSDSIKNYIWEKSNNTKVSTHKEITKTWELKTKYIKDEQVDILAQLAGTNEAYLQKIGDTTLTPIIITNKSYDYKYKVNVNNRLVSLSITAEEARTRITI